MNSDGPTRARAAAVSLLVVGIFGALGYRLWAIQVRDHAEFAARKRAQSQSVVVVERPRGVIVDARGEVLALSTPVESVWADPQRAPLELAEELSLNVPDFERRLGDRTAKFVWVKRKVSKAEADRVRALAKRFGGERAPFGIRTEYDREYPNGTLAVHVVGVAGELEEDPRVRGRQGIEKALDRELNGGTEEREVSVDGRRRILGASDDAWAGATVTLTIVAELQRVVEEELAAAGREHSPRWATAVVLDPRTGAVLAMANWTPEASLVNLATEAPYEPGSQLKAFLAAAALEERLVSPSTMFDCENGLWKFGSRILHDHHPYARLPFEDVIVKSSNIGAAKLGVLVLGPDRMRKWLEAFGFAGKTGIDLPGEFGQPLKPAPWSVSHTGISYTIGHEIYTTELQIAVAMAAIANGGSLMRPYVVRRVTRDDGTLVLESQPQLRRQVLRPATSVEMARILKRAVEEGTGKEAKVAGISVAGKTGTTQLKNRFGAIYGYVGSFAGFAPAEAPEIVVAVAVGRPAGNDYYGGKVAAPVFRRIVERGLPLVR